MPLFCSVVHFPDHLLTATHVPVFHSSVGQKLMFLRKTFQWGPMGLKVISVSIQPQRIPADE